MGKTITHSLLRGQLSRLLLLVTLAVFGVVGAKAVDKSDMTKIELGVTYTVPVSTQPCYYYEATETGKLTFTGTKCPRLYTDDTFATEGKNNANTAFTTNTVDVEAGTTYYFKASLEFNKKTFTASFKGSAAGAIGLLSVSPEESTTLDVTSESKSNIYVTFDTDIDKGSLSISIVAGGKTVSVDENPNVSSAKKIVIPTKETVYGLLADGTIKEGDDVKVEITGICDADNDKNLYNGDGKLSLTYKASKAPIGINSEASAIPTAFKSYWAKGNEAGVMKLVFTGNVGEVSSATLMFGNKDNDASGGYYEETLPMAIEGNTVTVDFTGVKRTQATMLPNYTAETYTNIAVKVAGVKDTDGNYAYSTSQGSVGSFSFNWTLEEVVDNFISQFDPIDSTVIDGKESIELWLSKKDVIDFTGVKFEYVNSSDKAKEAVMPKADCTIEDGDDGDQTITIPTPTDIQKKKALNIKVSLEGMTSLDGNDHAPITAVYNMLKLDLVKPVISGDVDTLHADVDSIKVQVTPELEDHIGVIYYYVVNASTGVTEHAGYMNKGMGCKRGNGVWSVEFIQDQAFFEGNQYYISAKAYCQDRKVTEKTPLAADSTDLFNGASKVYQYSSYKLVSLTPNPDSFVVEKAEDAVITLKFDGPVAMNDDTYTNINTGMGTYKSFDYIKPMDGDESAKYAKKWEISFQSFAKANNGAPIQMSLAAEDEQGRRVKGNSGLEVTSFFDYTYECSIGTPRLSFNPASGSTVSSLKTIVVKGAEILEAYTVARTNLALYDANDNKVAYAEEITPLIPASQANNYDYTPDSVEVTLNTEVITPGTYTFRVPKAFFNLGTQFNSVNCLAEEATYTIAAFEGVAYNLNPKAITPDTAKVQEYLGTIQVAFYAEIYANPTIEDSITFVNKQTREVIKGEAYVMGSTLYVMPSAEINASEEAYSYWTLSIPQGFVFNEAGTEANFAGGNANPTLVYNYTVGKEAKAADKVTSVPENGSTVTSLKTIELTWPDETTVGTGNTEELAVVKNENGETIATFSAYSPEFGTGFNQMVVNLPTEITSNGIYTISFPEGFFSFGEMGDRSSSAFTLEFGIGMATGISNVAKSADGKTVIFTLDGKKAAKATKGLYIINGKKVVVK